ncbi:Pentatricopeptide repeat-containing protein [Nymphaea thermarum]|nr:Pentatricopeptide repeat-containing protein [Nymphaea thermarum]
MQERDVITWNSMISGYRRHGLIEEALELYLCMNHAGIKGNTSTFSSVLGVCDDAGAVELGSQVHCLSILLGFDSSLFVGSALVEFYMQSSEVADAVKVFGLLPERNLATWNSVLSGFSRNGRMGELFDMLVEMRATGVEPNALSYCYVIHGCDHEGVLDQGREVQCHMIKSGLAESNLFVANALVDMYSSCGCLNEAIKSFEVIQFQDVISWNSIVSIHASHAYRFRALDLFSQMHQWGKSPTVCSLMELLNSSGSTQSIQLGEQIHGQIISLGFNGSVHIRSALINMYGKCKDMRCFERLFDKKLVSSLHENAIETRASGQATTMGLAPVCILHMRRFL